MRLLVLALGFLVCTSAASAETLRSAQCVSASGRTHVNLVLTHDENYVLNTIQDAEDGIRLSRVLHDAIPVYICTADIFPPIFYFKTAEHCRGDNLLSFGHQWFGDDNWGDVTGWVSYVKDEQPHDTSVTCTLDVEN